MKIFFIFVLGLALCWLWVTQEDNPFAQALNEAVGAGSSKSKSVEVTYRSGNILNGTLIAKHGSFVRLRRETDRKEIFVPFDQLTQKSRNEISLVKDFNQNNLENDLIKIAEKKVKPELLYIRELCTCRCPQSGRETKSRQGMLVDAYRDYLWEHGFKYEETTLQADKAEGGGYYMPQGIKDVPCFRIGDTIIYKRDRKKIQNAMIEHYLEKHRS